MDLSERRVRRRGFFLHSDTTGEAESYEVENPEGITVRVRVSRTPVGRQLASGEAEESQRARGKWDGRARARKLTPRNSGRRSPRWRRSLEEGKVGATLPRPRTRFGFQTASPPRNSVDRASPERASLGIGSRIEKPKSGTDSPANALNR